MTEVKEIIECDKDKFFTKVSFETVVGGFRLLENKTRFKNGYYHAILLKGL